MTSLVFGLASVASVNYVMFAITRTLTGMALAGFTVIVLPLGEADRGTDRSRRAEASEGSVRVGLAH